MVTLRRATIYNIVGALVPTLLALTTIPIYLHLIGPQRFGALSAIWIICGSAGSLDLGLTKAIAYFVAKFSSEDPRRSPQVVATALLIALLAALIGAVLVYLLSSWYFSVFFKADQHVIDELIMAMPLVALMSITNVLQGVIIGALQGSRHFLRANLFQTTMAAAIQLGPLVALVPSMRSMVPIITSVLLLRCLGLAFGLAAIAQALSVRALVAARRTEIRPLLSFSKWTMGISMLAPLMLFADKILLGALAGASALALYSIAFQLAQRVNILPVAVTSAVFPDLINGTLERRAELAERATSYIYLLITLPAFVAILALPVLLSWWLRIDPSLELLGAAGLLILAFWANCAGVVYHVVLLMANRPAAVFYTQLLEVLIFIPAMFLVIGYFGMVGAAAGFLILFSVEAAIFIYLSGLRHEGLKTIAAEFFILVIGVVILTTGERSIYIAMVAAPAGACIIAMLRWPLLIETIPSLRLARLRR